MVFFHQLAACVLFVTVGLPQGENERRRHIAHQRRRVFDRERDAFNKTAAFLARKIEEVARLRVEFAHFRQLVYLGLRHFHQPPELGVGEQFDRIPDEVGDVLGDDGQPAVEFAEHLGTDHQAGHQQFDLGPEVRLVNFHFNGATAVLQLLRQGSDGVDGRKSGNGQHVFTT